jgi:serine/threonine protein kinase/Leucine-rich repeat (LRR) protein
MAITVDGVCELLVRGRLLPAGDVAALRRRWAGAAGAQPADGEAFLRWLVTRGQLTEFQAALLARGQVDRLFLGPYKLLDRIGKGRMAGVFKGVHPTGQAVAIKVLPPSRAKEPELLARFRREARLGLRLKHPNVVRTFQVGEAGGLHYLVMEFLDGETLEDVLKRRGRLPAPEALRLVRQALQGLQHLHDQDVVHRDIKPANLIIVPAAPPGGPDTTQGATLKILDIGIGKALFDEGEPGGGQVELTREGQALGEPDYQAPEQARDARTADVRADVYSLGCVLYHALTGQPPFPGGNAVQKMVRHAREAPRPLREFDPALPAGLQQVMDRMLAKDPAQRYPTPDQAALALDACLSTEADGPAAEALPGYERWLAAEQSPPAPVAIPVRAKPSAARPRYWVAALAGGSVAVVGTCAVLAVGAVLLLRHHRQKSAAPETAPAVAESDEEWTQRVASLPAQDQVREVIARLKQRNPDFDGSAKPRVQDGVVTDLEFATDHVTDPSPVRALPGLLRLACTGSDAGKGKLTDLGPLRGMPLNILDCGNNPVTDLGPLRGMPLIFLGIAGTQVRDLAPVQDMPLLIVHCAGAPVRDLGPLHGKELTLLDAAGAPVEDLTPLRGMPLEALWCNVQPRRDAELLRSLSRLKEVNGRPLAEVQQEAAAEEKNFDAWAAALKDRPAAEQVKAVEDKVRELNPDFHDPVKPVVKDGAVVELHFSSDGVTDLAPVRALPALRVLVCPGSGPGKGRLASLRPLQDMKLTVLDCAQAHIRELAPLVGMPLATLNLNGNADVEDLAPLRGTRLTWLDVAGTHVRDLAPLRGLPLRFLACHDTPAADLSPLRDMPLAALSCDFRPVRDLPVVRSLKRLETLNNRPWRDVDAAQREFEAWVKRTAALPAEEQVQAVSDKLKALNPGFGGPVTPRIDQGAVVRLKFPADPITDLSPIRALPALQRLSCPASAPGKSRLADLWPLNGLGLKDLILSSTAVADLSPLEGMKLAYLDVAGTPVADLSPLKQASLVVLDVSNTAVTNLAPLRGQPLRQLRADLVPERDAELLRGMRTLATINGKPAADFGKPAAVAAAPPAPATAPRPQPRPLAKAPPTTLVLAGELVRVDSDTRELVLRLMQSGVVRDPYHAAWIIQLRRQLPLAAVIRNPAQRAAYVQNTLAGIAYHQAQLYRRFDQHQDVPLRAAADVRVRTALPKPQFDDKGNPRLPTADELKEMKGPDPNVPGFASTFAALMPGQFVEVQLAKPEAAGPPGDKGKDGPADASLQVVLIVILQQAS